MLIFLILWVSTVVLQLFEVKQVQRMGRIKRSGLMVALDAKSEEIPTAFIIYADGNRNATEPKFMAIHRIVFLQTS